MTWFEKLLIKIAVAKATARGHGQPEHNAIELIDAFHKINAGVKR